MLQQQNYCLAHAAYAASYLSRVAWIGLALAANARGQEPPANVTYVDHIQPIFRQHCFTCHGPDQQKNDLALNNYSAAITGGASGEVVVAGDPNGSYLWQLVNHEAEPAMPPNADKLPQGELDLIRAWIAGGLLERGDSVARKSNKPKVAEFTPSADNRPAGEPAMPEGLLREPVLHAKRRGAATALAVSPWAQLAAVGAAFQVSLYHVDTGELLGVLPFIDGTPLVLRFSREGGLLLVAGGTQGTRGIAALYDVKSGRRLATVGNELDAVLAADLSPDHGLVALGGPRRTVRVYRAADGALAYEITKHTDWVTAVEFSPDGKFLVTADRGGGMWLWDAANGRERGELRGHAEQITAVSWRDDSALLASASEDDTVRLWQPSGVQIKSWGAHGGGALSVQYSHDGRLVSVGRDQRIKTWLGDGAAERDVAGLDDAGLAARFTPDGSRLVASDWAGNVRTLDAATGNVLAMLDPNPPLLAERLAALEAEAAQARTSAQQGREALTAAEAQVAAAESAVVQARAQMNQVNQQTADAGAKLASVEQRLAIAAQDRARMQRVREELITAVQAIDAEITAAQAAASAEQSLREEAAAKHQAQEIVVQGLVDDLAKLRGSLAAARGQLEVLAQTAADRETAEATATARVDDLREQKVELESRQTDLEAIEELRAKYSNAAEQKP